MFCLFTSIYEAAVEKIIAKFPFQDQALSDLAFLDPCNRMNSTQLSVFRLCKSFMMEDPREIDEVTDEFLSFRVAPDHQLPSFDPSSLAAMTTSEQQCQRCTCEAAKGVQPGILMNNDASCYESYNIVPDELVKDVKTATFRSLQHQSPSAAND